MWRTCKFHKERSSVQPGPSCCEATLLTTHRCVTEDSPWSTNAIQLATWQRRISTSKVIDSRRSSSSRDGPEVWLWSDIYCVSQGHKTFQTFDQSVFAFYSSVVVSVTERIWAPLSDEKHGHRIHSVCSGRTDTTLQVGMKQRRCLAQAHSHWIILCWRQIVSFSCLLGRNVSASVCACGPPQISAWFKCVLCVCVLVWSKINCGTQGKILDDFQTHPSVIPFF